MGIGGQRHAPAALLPGNTRYPEDGWAPESVWKGAENLVPIGIQSPDCPARSESLYRLSYTSPLCPYVWGAFCLSTYHLIIFIVFVTTDQMHNYMSQQCVSLYIIYTATCFDISLSSSGSYTFVPR